LALGLHEAQDRGLMAADVPAAALARFLSGGTNELALWLHHEPNRESGKKQAEAALTQAGAIPVPFLAAFGRINRYFL
jgi:hypothetical protein